MSRPRPRALAISFVATSFGFGPVSKAVSIARSLHRTSPDAHTTFYGDGVAFDFATRSDAFDEVVRCDVDAAEPLERLCPVLRRADAVVSVLNTDLLLRWRAVDPPLHYVDSLDWMWPAPVAGLDVVTGHFVQDYLLRPDADRGNATVVPPITPVRAEDGPRSGLLVNLSGLSNPLSDGSCYPRYARVTLDALLPAARERYGTIWVCCNARLAAELRQHYPDVPIDHLPHDEFLARMATAERVLTSPGITTTVEAVALGTPLGFLLPQNYSQALILQRYQGLVPDEIAMRLDRFGPQYRVAPGLAEADGVARVLGHLTELLWHRRDALHQAMRDLVASRADPLPALRGLASGWERPGQDVVAEHVLASIAATVPS
jgi:hypothetical protein